MSTCFIKVPHKFILTFISLPLLLCYTCFCLFKASQFDCPFKPCPSELETWYLFWCVKMEWFLLAEHLLLKGSTKNLCKCWPHAVFCLPSCVWHQHPNRTASLLVQISQSCTQWAGLMQPGALVLPPDGFPLAHLESRVGIQRPEAEVEMGTGQGWSVTYWSAAAGLQDLGPIKAFCKGSRRWEL